jgi:hypothetical protein
MTEETNPRQVIVLPDSHLTVQIDNEKYEYTLIDNQLVASNGETCYITESVGNITRTTLQEIRVGKVKVMKLDA